MIQDVELEGKIRKFFENTIEKRQYVDGLPMPCDIHQAVVLILHKLEHFLNGGFGLRQLCDWAMEYDKELASKIIERIMEFGNFGRKEEAYGQRYFVDVQSSNRITSFLHVLNSACKYHWPVCEKHPILMPIAPFVICGKYLKMYKAGQRPKIKVFSLYKKAGPKQRLYRELKPFVVSGNEE